MAITYPVVQVFRRFEDRYLRHLRIEPVKADKGGPLATPVPRTH